MQHVALRNSGHALPAGKRVYAVGDIHGRLDLFETLIDKITNDNAGRGASDVDIVLLGDLIDRGPDSRAVVDRAMRWDEDFATLHTIMGNHEASLLAVLNGETRWTESWLGYGGRETLASYGIDASQTSGDLEQLPDVMRAAMPESHIEWLKDLPLSHRCGDYLFVHAGIRPDRGLDDQDAKDIMWIRGEFLDSEEDHGAMIVHGHSISPQPEIRDNRIGIDTGAFFSHTLTALGLEGNERWLLQT